MTDSNGYNWKYRSIGGIVRVQIESGEDIAHLGELDQKKWTVLSCPTNGLEFDKKTLDILDTDCDGRIRIDEVIKASQWLTSVIKDKDRILKGDSELPLDQINTENEQGKKLYDSAKQILANLGLEKDSISVADASDSVAIFAKTIFNGDGIITAAATEDPGLKDLISTIIGTVGSVTDRSGVEGINAEKVESFFTACKDYSDWKAAADADKETILPFGDNTAAALAACDALKDKIADFFMRCKLINFNSAAAAAVDVSVDKIGAISDKDLSQCNDEIATYPLARPNIEGALPFNAVNPAWRSAFDTLKSSVLDILLPGKESMTEDEWNGILSKFSGFIGWTAAKKGAEAEGIDSGLLKEIASSNHKETLLGLIDKDLALKEESESIDAVGKLTLLYRDLYSFLNNYVSFNNFYGRNDKVKAIFEAGKLYIDERCCNLCLKVDGPGNHAEAAGLSGMFLIYCTCTSKALGKTQNIVAVMTDGNIKHLRPGKNAIFYDFEGNSWEAVVTSIVDNPISIKQAFWSPYRKLAKFINDKIDKSAAEKDSKATSSLIEKADKAEAPAAGSQPHPFDIGKFAGIFAALGMAIAGIGVALKSLISGIVALKWWQVLLVIAAIMLIISAPACFIAWKKLRKRNLGPVLNANGWAINSTVLVNILFGSTLTSIAKYPVTKGKDPFKKRAPWWKAILKALLWIIVIVAVAGFILFKSGKLPCCKCAEPAPTEEVAAEAATQDSAVEVTETSAPEAAPETASE